MCPVTVVIHHGPSHLRLLAICADVVAFVAVAALQGRDPPRHRRGEREVAPLDSQLQRTRTTGGAVVLSFHRPRAWHLVIEARPIRRRAARKRAALPMEAQNPRLERERDCQSRGDAAHDLGHADHPTGWCTCWCDDPRAALLESLEHNPTGMPAAPLPPLYRGTAARDFVPFGEPFS